MSIPQDLLKEFDEWLYEARPNGATVYEGSLMIMSLLVRLRSAMTLPEVHVGLHNMLRLVELRLQANSDIMGPNGQPVPIILAEHWREDAKGQELLEWLKNPEVPDTFPEDWCDAPTDS